MDFLSLFLFFTTLAPLIFPLWPPNEFEVYLVSFFTEFSWRFMKLFFLCLRLRL